jgi:hypothetical protein
MHRFILAAALLSALSGGAFANETAQAPVVVPWGAWLADLMDWARTGAVGVIAWATAQFAPPLVKMFVSEAAVRRAVDYAIARVDGACRHEELTVDVSNDVAREAVRYLVTHEPAVAAWLGETIGARVLAQLSNLAALPSDAIAPPPAPTPA